MKSNNILEILKGKNITIPYILIKNMDELKISYKEMIFLSYLIKGGNTYEKDDMEYIVSVCSDVRRIITC